MSKDGSKARMLTEAELKVACLGVRCPDDVYKSLKLALVDGKTYAEAGKSCNKNRHEMWRAAKKILGFLELYERCKAEELRWAKVRKG